MRKLTTLFTIFILALTACGGGGDGDASSDEPAVGSPESKVIRGTNIQESTVGGAAITQGTTTVDISNAVVVDNAGEQSINIDVTITNDSGEFLRFPEFSYVCNIYFGNIDNGRVLTGYTSGVQPGETFTGTLAMQVPVTRNIDPACMADGYIDVRYDASISGGVNMFNDDLATGIFRLDTSVIDAVN